MKLAFCLLAATAVFGQGVWERRAPYPVRATEVSAAALGGKIYALCGILPNNTNDEGLHIYDPVRDEWSEGPAIPIAGGADHCNVAVSGGKLYLVGAMRTGQPFVDGSTYEFDPATRQWTNVARMLSPRAASGVAVIDNRIYVAGGLVGGASVATLEVYDPELRQWIRLPNMPTARDHLTAQAIGGRFYAIAGRDGGRDLNANEEFDPRAMSWRTRTPIPTARGGVASGVLRNRIQVLGGEGNSGRPENTFVQNEEYDPVSDTWATLTQLANPRHGFYGATLDGRIFTPGGGPVAGFSYSDTNDAFFLPLPNAPSIAARGVRNAASFREEFSPGAILTVTGENFSQGEQVAVRFPYGTQLNQTTVRVNGAAATLLYVSPGRINFQLPYTLVPGPLNITVSHMGLTSAVFSAPDAFPTSPGIFTFTETGEGQGAVLIAGTGLIARATRDAFSRAARRGETVEVYATGLGRVDFPPRPGEAAPADPLVKAMEAAEVTIGGAPAEVRFAGLVPGAVGVYRIDATIAASAQTGISIPVTVRAGGRTSNTVTIAVVE